MPRRDYSKVAFAAVGDTNTIPDAVQPDGSVSLAAGWPFDYERDNGAGGGTPDPLAKNISREDMNGILNEATASIGEMQLNGYPIWVATAAPYPIKANVRHNNINWRSTVANNSTTPGAVGATWEDVDAAATTALAGKMRFGTPAEQVAGILATVAANPAGVLALITSLFPKRSFGLNDFIRIPDVPGGFIFQWQRITHTAGKNVLQTFSFPIPFPNGPMAKAALDSSTVNSRPVVWSNDNLSDTNTTFNMHWTFGDITSSTVIRSAYVLSVGN